MNLFRVWSWGVFLGLAWTAAGKPGPESLQWASLPALPVAVSGASGGVVGGRLVIAGGNHFPDRPPWKGGSRRFRDEIYLLDPGAGALRRSRASLPVGLTFAAGGTVGGGIVIAGGETPAGVSARVFRLEAAGEDVTVREIRPLPLPVTDAATAVIGQHMFLAGGLSSAPSESLRRGFVGEWDEMKKDMTWKEIPPWPGPGRFCAVAAATGSAFYLISGMQQTRASDGSVALQRPYLRDAFVYEFRDDPASGKWRRLPDLPIPIAAAPTPAIHLEESGQILVLGGLVGDDAGISPDHYPPFPRRVTVWDPVAGAWSVRENAIPAACARCDVPVVRWDNGWALIAGETLPARRSAAVDFLTIP